MSIRFIILLWALLIFSCNSLTLDANRPLLLQLKHTGIDFVNTITTNDTINLLNFQYCYNGGGIGVGDFNNDGLQDVYFTGNQVSSKLYINQGKLTFQDITQQAQVETHQWVTGVSIVDINADGWEDIYLNVGGANCNDSCQNLLFINQGLNEEGFPYFIEKAKSYGLNQSSYSQQTVFFDADRDGDLDAYILSNGNIRFDKNSPMPKRYFPSELTDVLLENNTIDSLDHPYFSDISLEKGITKKGFGLGLGIHDFDNNGWVDIYVGNDFITNDILYMNLPKKKGTNYFTDKAPDYLKHQTFNAMGVDLADLTQDGIPEILVLDMLPENYRRQKEMLGSMNYDKYLLAVSNDYTPQFMRNTLQVSDGRTPQGDLIYSEQGFQLNIAKTDWSWAPLFADFDSDGDLDLYVTNGYGKDITNLDFINYSKQNNVFGTDETRFEALRKLIDELEPVYLKNYYFENTEGIGFTPKKGFSNISLSNGAAYADFDNDGDLDLMVNNINQEAFVFENTLTPNKHNFVKIQLQGESNNPKAIGAKVILWSDGKSQSHFQSRIKGYLSSVDPQPFFGLSSPKADSLWVRWPSGEWSTLKNIRLNSTIVIRKDSLKILHKRQSPSPMLKIVDKGINKPHKENKSIDFLKQPLLATQHSKFGPALAATPDDKTSQRLLFVGSSHGEKSRIWKQNEKGIFSVLQELTPYHEDTAAIFSDLDNDGDFDLIVGSGGNQFAKGDSLYRDRIYFQTSKGFIESNIHNGLFENTSCIRVSDFDRDGNPDFFFGSNIVPQQYPKRPKQGLFSWENNNLKDKTPEALANIGMVKDAIWIDYDMDGWEDLVVVGDWMKISFFKNNKGRLQQDSPLIMDDQNRSFPTFGWWNTIAVGDFDRDGDPDFIIGNQGTNNFINPSPNEPVYIFTKDFDNNGSVDPIMGAYAYRDDEKGLYPLQSRDDILRQLPILKKKYTSYKEFANTDFINLLSIEDLDQQTLKVTTSQSVFLENLGGKQFIIKPLDISCQQAPINDILVSDIDEDGHLDILLAGNDFYAETLYGRYDAFNGKLLKGDGMGKFKPISTTQSGFYIPNHTNQLLELKNKTETIFLAGQNNDSLLAFKNIQRSNE